MGQPENEREHLNRLSNVIIGAALRVHEEIGPGMLESAYEANLMLDLLDRELNVEREKPLPLNLSRTATRLRLPSRSPR